MNVNVENKIPQFGIVLADVHDDPLASFPPCHEQNRDIGHEKHDNNSYKPNQPQTESQTEFDQVDQ
jgi:hypothetical protein